MARVEVAEGESLDGALRRFKKMVQLSGKLQEARRKERYEKPSDKRRREQRRRERRQSR
jgi:small subunit ribosomal protein S21